MDMQGKERDTHLISSSESEGYVRVFLDALLNWRESVEGGPVILLIRYDGWVGEDQSI